MGTLALKKVKAASPLYEGYLVSDNFYSLTKDKLRSRDRTRRDEFSRRLEKWVKFCCLEKWPFLGHSRCLEKNHLCNFLPVCCLDCIFRSSRICYLTDSYGSSVR